MSTIRIKTTNTVKKVSSEEAKELVQKGVAEYVSTMPQKESQGYQTRELHSSQIKTK